ncbi:transport permease protein [Virgisporangium aliadipatigenens]|uniref:Transport permease protein n=1 Tax=Virgisporangium aliadipatigenens TaxID=741659 RepID=A0A8J3YIE6_9ACTN|nr:ABC transporter permease [Virgisporangium aliadipatigenens]GIJ44585.1 transport permease protein [Virgisporangium aliadipatigenens]
MSDTLFMTQRRLKALAKQPWFLFFALVQPIIWLFLFGNLFRRIVELPGFGGGSYLTYLVPGVVVMSAMSSNMWAGMGTLEEIERGTLNRFLVTPVRRGAIINANVIEQALTTTFQSVAIVLLGWAAGAHYPGAHYPGGIVGVLVLLVAAVLLGTVFSAMSNAVGMLVRQRETIIGLNTLLLLPLTFLSTAFMAKELMPGWMRALTGANPVDWALAAGRGALTDSPDWGRVCANGGALLLLAGLAVWLSTRTFRAYQRAV